MFENKNHRSQSRDREPFDDFSKESEDSLIQKLKERLKVEQANLPDAHDSDTSFPERNQPDLIEQAESEISLETPEKEREEANEEVGAPMSENARRLAARRRAMQHLQEDEETLQKQNEEAQRNARQKRQRKRLSKKAKIWFLAGLLLFIVSFAITGFVLHLPNPERDIPRNVVQAIFSTKYMEAAEIWGPLLSDDTKRRSMNKLNARIRPYVTKECYRKLESIGLIGTVHKLAYESECNMVFTAFDAIAGTARQTSLHATISDPASKVQAFRVVIDQIDVVNKAPIQSYTFVVIVTMTYHDKELIIEDLSFDDESQLPVKTKPLQ